MCWHFPYTEYTLNCHDIIFSVNRKTDVDEMKQEILQAKELLMRIRRPPGTVTQIEMNCVIAHGGWLVVVRDFFAEPLACEQYLAAERGDIVFIYADDTRLQYAGEEPVGLWIWAAVTTMKNRSWWPEGAGWIPVSHLRVPAISMGWT